MAILTAPGEPVELPPGKAPTSFRLMPAGRFKARDGRPAGLQGWNLTDDLANKLISTATRQQDRFLIDYDHQTINAPANGGKAPAAGWFSRLAWRPGDGLYATGVEWTLPAQKAISAREYRYISPVLTYDATTGDVTGLLMAAIVNYPALDGLTDLAVAASARFGRTTTPTLNATEIYARRKPA